MKLTIHEKNRLHVINLHPAFFVNEVKKLPNNQKKIITPIEKASSLSQDISPRNTGFVLEQDDKVLYDSFDEKNRNHGSNPVRNVEGKKEPNPNLRHKRGANHLGKGKKISFR